MRVLDPGGPWWPALTAAALLLTCWLVGVAAVAASGLDASLEEWLAYGALVGAMLVTAAGFLVALVTGLSGGSVALTAGLLLVPATGYLTGPARGRFLDRVHDFVERWRPRAGGGREWWLALLLLLCWPFTLTLLGQSYRLDGSGGLLSGNAAAYADWALHLTIAGSFAYGANLPPEFTIDPGHPLGYPFLIDFLAAMLVKTGSDLPGSIVLSSAYLGLVLPPVAYLAVRRFGLGRSVAFWSVVVFFLGGGLGFYKLPGLINSAGWKAVSHPGQLFTQDDPANLQLLNPVLAYLLPQRSILFGLAIALLVPAVVWSLLPGLRAGDGSVRRPLLAAGLLLGISPAFHVHGFLTALALIGFWFLLERRRELFAAVVVAIVVGLPVAAWMIAGHNAHARWQPGWLSAADGHHDSLIWFWLKNTGLFIPLMLVGQFWPGLLPRGLAPRLAPIWLWFAVPNLAVLQPWDWDNTKYLVFWLGFGSILVGAVLVRLARRSVEGAVLAVLLTGSLCLAGGLDLAWTLRPTTNVNLFVDAAGVRTATWVRGHTRPTALFAVAPEHNNPIPMLAGRRIVAGYWGWLWSYGIDDAQARADDERTILHGGAAGLDAARRYRVEYVLIGPQELAAGADPSFWDSNATAVHRDGAYTVYRLA